MGAFLSPSVFAGDRVLQLGHRADISGMKLRNLRGRLALHHLDVLQAFGGVAIEILKRGVVLQHAGENFEVVDAPGEGIGDGLENGNREGLGVRDLSLDGFGLVFARCGGRMAGGLAARSRRGKDLGAEVQHRVAADVVQRGAQQHRKNFPVAQFFAQAFLQVFHRQRALFRKTPASIRLRPRPPFRPASRAPPLLRPREPRGFPRCGPCRRRRACRSAPSW